MNRHILVVDDDLSLRSLLQELLEDEAYEVDTATNGLEALEKPKQQRSRYAVILLDLTMSQMDGLQLL